jgi:hypothetical protein
MYERMEKGAAAEPKVEPVNASVTATAISLSKNMIGAGCVACCPPCPG